MSKEIVKKASTEVSTHVEPLNFGTDQGAMMMDYVLPRMLIQQAMSKSVVAGESFMGDVMKSTTGDIIMTCNPASKADNREVLRVSKEKTIRIIPLAIKMLWTHKEEINGKFEWKSESPRNVSNADLPFEYEDNGVKKRNYNTLGVFALIEHEVEAAILDEKSGGLPDFSKLLLPVYISFISSSFKAGKEVSTFITNALNLRNSGRDVYPFNYSLPLYVEKKEDAKGTYGVFRASQAAKAVSPEVFAKAKQWFETISKGFVRVDEAAEVGEESHPVSEQNF